MGCAMTIVGYSAAVPAICGGMAEWLKALAWNACRLVRVSWVRIPLPPPIPQISLQLRIQNRHIMTVRQSNLAANCLRVDGVFSRGFKQPMGETIRKAAEQGNFVRWRGVRLP